MSTEKYPEIYRKIIIPTLSNAIENFFGADKRKREHEKQIIINRQKKVESISRSDYYSVDLDSAGKMPIINGIMASEEERETCNSWAEKSPMIKIINNELKIIKAEDDQLLTEGKSPPTRSYDEYKDTILTNLKNELKEKSIEKSKIVVKYWQEKCKGVQEKTNEFHFNASQLDLDYQEAVNQQQKLQNILDRVPKIFDADYNSYRFIIEDRIKIITIPNVLISSIAKFLSELKERGNYDSPYIIETEINAPDYHDLMKYTDPTKNKKFRDLVLKDNSRTAGVIMKLSKKPFNRFNSTYYFDSYYSDSDSDSLLLLSMNTNIDSLAAELSHFENTDEMGFYSPQMSLNKTPPLMQLA